jgi:hypothetical protein
VDQWLDLSCHPSAPAKSVRALQARFHREANGDLRISYRLSGDLSRIRIAPPDAPTFAADLWRHTCFEAFIAVEGRSAYYEFNFAPSSEWAVYAFTSYRQGGPLPNETMRPAIVVRSADENFDLDALVHLDHLSPSIPRAPLRVGLNAVVEAVDGLSYWALRHSAGKPDFHNAEGFALRIDPPRPESER